MAANHPHSSLKTRVPPAPLLGPGFALHRNRPSLRQRVSAPNDWRTSRLATLTPLFWLFLLLSSDPAPAQTIPTTQTTALDNHPVTLPRDLTTPATILILGFGRHSEDATTAWEKPVRQQLAHPGAIAYYDIAMLAEVPGFIRPLVLRAIRHEVPDVLKPNFLPLTVEEDAWKRTANYTPDQPQAAYVLLVDRSGRIQWSTHAAFTPAVFDDLAHRAQALAGGVAAGFSPR